MPRDPATYPMDDRVRAQHMLDAARDAQALVRGRARGELESDMMLRRALVNAVQEIGEAATKISAGGRARLSALPWRQIVGMRQRLVHGYDDINLDILWNVATLELTPLISALEQAFRSWALLSSPDASPVDPHPANPGSD